MTIIDAHSHLWQKQDTWVEGKRILSLKNGRSIFMDEEVQMLPPWLVDGVNSAEVFLSNMDYAQVGGAVVVQEVIDGNQNAYLTEVQQKYPERFFCMGMAWNLEEAQAVHAAGLKGIAFPGHRMHDPLHNLLPVFKFMEEKGMVLSMCLGESEAQIAEMKEMIQELSGWTEDEVRMLFYDRRFPSADYGRNPVVEVHALIQFFAKKEMVMKRLQKWWDDHGETITYLRKLR